ncbi:MAG: ATP-binding protein [Proteobacteria bacterium]|nr:ATP-binding protein [Pseudomonadota bacterium]
MERLYHRIIQQHFAQDEQMIFLCGPRQVGKTTISQTCVDKKRIDYLNWDVKDHRADIIAGPIQTAQRIGLQNAKEHKPIVIFDELHKYKYWRDFIKGFYDLYKKESHIIVTGSAKLDIHRRSGDSLMGRYFPYLVHPFSVAELLTTELPESLIRQPSAINAEQFSALWKYGGFPDPYLKNNAQFWRRWNHLRHEQLFRRDIKDLTHIQEMDQLEILALILQQQAGQLVNYSQLAQKINVSVNTVKRWISTLKNFYYCFTIKPWKKNITRSLLKEPKIFLWDWSEINDAGHRLENFVACHLLKAIHFWNDSGMGKFELFFIRDKEQNEVDFLITQEQKPWILLEVKMSANNHISKNLHRFQEQTQAPHALQVVFNLEYENIDCFSYHKPVVVPLITFLSQLI